MKKFLIFAFIGLFAFSISGCVNEKNENSSVSTEPETSAVSTVEENYKINIPYSYFNTLSDEDCIVTGTDMRNGILSKDLSGNGGIILTVVNDKYDDLLKYAKSEIENEINTISEINSDIEKVEYSENFDVISIYLNHSYFETQPTNEQTNDGEPMAQMSIEVKSINYGNIFKKSIYYQALIKKTDTELLTCKCLNIDNSDNSVVDEIIYPEK